MGAGDPFRRVRPGEAVRVSAIAWNALMDLVRPQAEVSGGGAVATGLPQQIATLSGAAPGGRSWFMGEAVVLGSTTDLDPAPATLPLASGLTFSAVERRVFAPFRPAVAVMDPNNRFTIGPSADDAFAICIHPRRMQFVTAGYAWTRVRALKRWHRFARRCLPQLGDGATENAASIGCLNSCAYGRAEIVGWATAAFDPGQTTAALTDTLYTVAQGTPGGTYWALVRF